MLFRIMEWILAQLDKKIYQNEVIRNSIQLCKLL